VLADGGRDESGGITDVHPSPRLRESLSRPLARLSHLLFAIPRRGGRLE
jgi:hypothetical protein